MTHAETFTLNHFGGSGHLGVMKEGSHSFSGQLHPFIIGGMTRAVV